MGKAKQFYGKCGLCQKINEKDLNQKSKVISHPNIGTWGQRRLPIIHSAEHNPRCQHFAQDGDYYDDLDVPMIVIASFAGDDGSWE